jgi:hypothetical protein
MEFLDRKRKIAIYSIGDGNATGAITTTYKIWQCNGLEFHGIARHRQMCEIGM